MAHRVAVGIPVRNGERFVAAAIESVLAQDFGDFELLVADNASTDGTVEICRDLARRDSRVRVLASEVDLGAAPNHNRAFAETSGEYFKWLSHDDMCAPGFLSRCVAALDRDPGAVLAFPRASIVDEGGAEIERYEPRLATDSPDPALRFGELLKGHKCFQVYGVIRRSALARTDLIGRYPHGDGVLLERLALAGRFLEVPEHLHLSRLHPGQSMAFLADSHWAYQRYAAWFDTRRKGRLVFPHWRLLLEHARSIASARVPYGSRARCLGHLCRWAAQHVPRLRGDLTFAARRSIGRDPLAAARGAPGAAVDREGPRDPSGA